MRGTYNERDLEVAVVEGFSSVFPTHTLIRRQLPIKSGFVDMLLKREDMWVVVEIKALARTAPSVAVHAVDGAIGQLYRYMYYIRESKEFARGDVGGIVLADVVPDLYYDVIDSIDGIELVTAETNNGLATVIDNLHCYMHSTPAVLW